MKKYFKPLIAFTLFAIFICSNLVTVAAYEDAERAYQDDVEAYLNTPANLLDSSNVEIDFEDITITQEDLTNNFLDYAQESATATFPEAHSKKEFVDTANVVGVVLDDESNEPIPEASIYADGAYIVSTGEDGRFQIKNMPNGTYTWTIKKEGYRASEYLNYPIDGSAGANIYTFNISKDGNLERDRNDVYLENHKAEEDCEEIGENVMSRALQKLPTVDSYVSVDYNNKVSDVAREKFVYIVISSELYSPGYYVDNAMGDSQISALYVAQAIAINTFVENAKNGHGNHSNCDVCSSFDCCQNYDPTYVTQAAINAAASIFTAINEQI
jgi:hypothetical protein